MSAAREPKPPLVKWPDGTAVSRGHAALVDLLTAVGGPAVAQPIGWTAWIGVSHGVGSETSCGTLGGGRSPNDAVHACLAARDEGDPVTISPLLTHEAPTWERGRTVEQRALGCIVLRMELAELFAPGGPLADGPGTSRTPGSRYADLSAARRSLARAFAKEHLRNACFPPTRIIDRGWTLDLVYVFSRARLDAGRILAQVSHVGEALCEFLHAARVLDPFQPIDVTGLLDGSYAPLCALIRLARATAWDMDMLYQRATGLRAALAAANPSLRPGTGAPPPAAMGLHTLPPSWDLGDLALEPHERQHLVPDGLYMEPDPEVLCDLVAQLARRGHGWFDVEALAADPRFRLHALLGLRQAGVRSLKHTFRAALGERDQRYPVRLPYGIVGLVRVAGAEPGERARYALKVRDGGKVCEVDLDWDTLTSPAATARAIGKVVKRLPAIVSAKVWRAVLDLALADPRVTRTLRPTNRPGTLPLTAHIRTFFAKLDDPLRERTPASRDDLGCWPIVREGRVIFRRKALEAHLAGAGVACRSKELTLAIESLGGGPRGIMHFPGAGKIRVWFAPILEKA